MLQEKGLNPRDEVLEIQEVFPSTKVRHSLELGEDERVIEMKRLRFADNEPIVLESSFYQKVSSRIAKYYMRLVPLPCIAY